MRRTFLSRSALGLALVLLGIASAGAQPRAPTLPTLPIAVTVADDGGAVVTDEWIATQLENANTIFAPHGLSFRITERHRMDATHAALENRQDRHALGALLHPRVIDWFVVRSLRDVDDPSLYRRGVHWRPVGQGVPDGAHLVIVSSIAGETVLAHELGHYFGNPHSDVPGNIMSYERGEVPPFFDAAQARRIRRFARRFLREGSLAPAPRE